MTQSIALLTEIINGATKQLETLGGISGAVTETKKSVIQTAKSLKSAAQDLQDSMQDFASAASLNNLAKTFEELSSFDDSVLNKSNSGGIFYTDLKEFINGDSSQAKEIAKLNQKLKQVGKIVNSNGTKELQQNIADLQTYNEVQKNKQLFNNEQIRKISNSIRQKFYSTDQNVSFMEKKTTRILELSKKITEKSSMVQMQRLNVMYLNEILKELQNIGLYMAMTAFVTSTHYKNSIKGSISFQEYNERLATLTDKKGKKTNQKRINREFCQKYKCNLGVNWAINE